MAERRPLLYYITDRSQLSASRFSAAQYAGTSLPGDESARYHVLLDKIAEATRAGVDYIQLREKDLSTRELEQLACEAVSLIRRLKNENQALKTRLLINSRTDVALAVGTDGVHLRSGDLSPADVRRVVALKRSTPIGENRAACGPRRSATENQSFSPTSEAVSFPNSGYESSNHFLIGVSCHSATDVLRAESEGADFVVFAPVFEKKDAPNAIPQGLAALREACKAHIPVLALGGVTLENAAECLEAGAAGVAGIRLFQENKISNVVGVLRVL